MYTQEQFIKDLRSEFEEYNKFVLEEYIDLEVLDIDFLMAPIKQNLFDCSKFLNGIFYGAGLTAYPPSPASNDVVYVMVDTADGERYCIHFTSGLQSENYCNCKASDEGYDPEKQCCGTRCDWLKPSFYIEKIERMYLCDFRGTQKDLWNWRKNK